MKIIILFNGILEKKNKFKIYILVKKYKVSAVFVYHELLLNSNIKPENAQQNVLIYKSNS